MKKAKKPWYMKLWGMRSRLTAWGIALMIVLFMQVNALATVGKTPLGGASYRFVQLQTGETIEAQVVPGSHRSDEVISRFAADIVTLGFKWDTSKKYVEDRKILFPASYAAVGNLFERDAQLKWGVIFATKYGQTRGSTQRLQNSYALLTSDPVVTKQSDGLWFVEVKAVRFITDGKGKIYDREKLDFKMAIEAINPSTESFWTLADKGLEPYLEQAWASGLVVVDIVDMQGYT